ncbi:WXG100 family type VII secretion target [Streptomyces lydicus]|uniref:WXG100 family type VII secretion target n=1 Tax=Streptomyces lydicus TaxID=47763 RepID=UPI0036E1AB62
MGKKETSEPSKMPTNTDYSSWDAGMIHRLFTGQDKAYESGQPEGWTKADPGSFYQAAGAVQNMASALAETRSFVSELGKHVARGDYWSGAAADSFSQLLHHADSVLGEQTSSLGNHVEAIGGAGDALDVHMTNAMNYWNAACAAVENWWYGLSNLQRMTWMMHHKVPPVEVKDGVTYFHISDIPSVQGPMEKGMQEELSQLAAAYRTAQVRMPAPSAPQFSAGGGSGLSAPNLQTPGVPQFPDTPSLDTSGLSAGLPSDAANMPGTPSFDPSGASSLASPGMPSFDPSGASSLASPGMPSFDPSGMSSASQGMAGSPSEGSLDPSSMPSFDSSALQQSGSPDGFGTTTSAQGAGHMPATPQFSSPGSVDPGQPTWNAPSLSDAGQAFAPGGMGDTGTSAFSGQGSGAPGTPTWNPPSLGGSGQAGFAPSNFGGSDFSPTGANTPDGGSLPMAAMPFMPSVPLSSGAGRNRSGTSMPSMSSMPFMPEVPEGGGGVGSRSALGRSSLPAMPKPPVFDPATVGTASAKGMGRIAPGLSGTGKPPAPLQKEFENLLRNEPKMAGLSASLGKGPGSLGKGPGMPEGLGPLGKGPGMSEGPGAAGLAGRGAAAEAQAARVAAAEAGMAGRMAGAGAVRGGGAMGGMPFMPPMGAGAGQRGNGGERERTTWLLEDEDVWGANGPEGDQGVDGVIGRAPRQ